MSEWGTVHYSAAYNDTLFPPCQRGANPRQGQT